ncbi:MAG: arginine--tRNA ligase [Actinobacteria bacterium]|jgi:arginyl-tRNA synthetase|nr:arginine--tRNA ligase [Actinomycetota bacterium]
MARPELLDPVLGDLASRIRAALLAAGLPEAEADLERPRQPEHGDWATTAPLRLAKPAKRPPREIAQALIDHLDLPDAVESVEIAGPGFVNFRLAHRYHEALVHRVVAAGDDYGRRNREQGERETVNVEFVSANPTGPLHVGAGRWAATGDAIAALLEADGHEVVREYYVNDAGEQVRRFGESVVLTARGLPLGDDHYRGSYIPEVAEQLRAEHGDGLFEDIPDTEIQLGGGAEHAADGELVEDAAVTADPRVDPRIGARVGVLAVEAMRQRIQGQMHQLGVDFDVWFSERHLHDTGAIEAVIGQLKADGRTYEADGATYLRTEQFGDDKDRVIVRSDGRPTYFASDLAYMRDKWERVTADGRSGRLYYLLGADHHGYVGRLLAAAECLGLPRDRVEVRIGQLVNLLRGGEPVRMSKRTGEMIALDEVVDEVGPDVTRYHFLRQGLDTMVDFDLDVVAQQSMENPVYYVQYAHARINSLIRTADERGFDHGSLEDADLTRLTHPAELQLLTAMAQLPIVVDDAADLRATQRLARYAEELAGTFHRFYTECRVLVEGDDQLGQARYWLAVAAKQVLVNALALLRVTAPERM